jgi:hypothetical protein
MPVKQSTVKDIMFGVADSPVATIPQYRSHSTLSHTEPRPSTCNLQPLAPHSFKPQHFAQISYQAPGPPPFNIYLSFTTHEHLLLFESSHACVGTRADSETSASSTLRLIILTLPYVTVLELPEYPLHIQLQSCMGQNVERPYPNPNESPRTSHVSTR